MSARRFAVLIAAATVLTAKASVSRALRKAPPSSAFACKPDVYRLCKWYIPSHSAITWCLRKNIEQLSTDCRAVMEGRLR